MRLQDRFTINPTGRQSNAIKRGTDIYTSSTTTASADFLAVVAVDVAHNHARGALAVVARALDVAVLPVLVAYPEAGGAGGEGLETGTLARAARACAHDVAVVPVRVALHETGLRGALVSSRAHDVAVVPVCVALQEAGLRGALVSSRADLIKNIPVSKSVVPPWTGEGGKDEPGGSCSRRGRTQSHIHSVPEPGWRASRQRAQQG
jgi:hypothetical protein